MFVGVWSLVFGVSKSFRAKAAKDWREEFHSDIPGSNESCLILLILSNHPTPKRNFNAETPESAKARAGKRKAKKFQPPKSNRLNLRSAAFTPLHHRLPIGESCSAISPRARRTGRFAD
jgi:hypothetical protein